MAKMTAKYRTACDVAKAKGIKVTSNQEKLYDELADRGFLWDSE